MGHVGDVHAYFPQVLAQRADGQGIVEVLRILGVDGKGRHAAEVLPLRDFLCLNLGGNLFRRVLHRLGVHVGQAELGQDGVHLGVVVARLSQYVNHLPDGVLGLVGPLYHFHHSLVAVLSSLEPFFRDEYVVGQRPVLGKQESIRLGHLQRAHKRVVGPLQYLHHLAFGLAPLALGVEHDFYPVVVHGMGRVALGNEYRIAAAVGDKGVLPVALALECPRQFAPVVVDAELPFLYLAHIVIVGQLAQNVNAQHLLRMRGEAQPREDSLQGQHLARPPMQEVGQQRCQFFLFHALTGLFLFLFFLLCHAE